MRSAVGVVALVLIVLIVLAFMAAAGTGYADRIPESFRRLFLDLVTVAAVLTGLGLAVGWGFGGIG